MNRFRFSAIGTAWSVFAAWMLLALALPHGPSLEAVNTGDYAYYDMGALNSQTLIWVDPVNGNDSNAGTARSNPVQTVDEAWRRIPTQPLSSHGYTINLVAGAYGWDNLPNYWEQRAGTYTAPIILQAADGPGTAILGRDINMANVAYFYLLGVTIRPNPATDTFHCELCDHILLRDVLLDGGTYVPNSSAAVAYDNLKVNQSQYVYVERTHIQGGSDNTLDFVAVQHGHILDSLIHNAQDWCAYIKGGSAYFSIAGNEIYDCGTGGFTAGQGTGFQYMVAPWLHYEVYDTKVVNNYIHDTAGAGLGVNGGYNILLAHNTLVRIGQRSHVIEVAFGERTCDGNAPPDPVAPECAANLTAGGWGTTQQDGQTTIIYIPNKNIFIFNNLIYNPPDYPNGEQHFAIYGPRTNPPAAQTPTTATTDHNLQIRGNLIWNGPAGLPLGIEDSDQGCQAGNPSCNAAQLVADNAINTVAPTLVSPLCGDVRPAAGSTFTIAVALANFPSWDTFTPAVPAGALTNSVNYDRSGALRGASIVPGVPCQYGCGLCVPANLCAGRTEVMHSAYSW